jgi:hypothetical protein
MDLDELLSSMPDVETTTAARSAPFGASSTVAVPDSAHMAMIDNKRSHIATQIIGGEQLTYRGKTVTVEMVDSMRDVNFEELYAKVEAHHGAAMCKSFEKIIINGYVKAASSVLPIPEEKEEKLKEDLAKNPLVKNMLRWVCSVLYTSCRDVLGPIAVVATTVNHCQWQTSSTPVEGNGEQAKTEASSDENSATASSQELPPVIN